MIIENVKIIDGKKFMWDGISYHNEEDAKKAMSTYEQNGFETHIFIEENNFMVYTRRVVTQIIVEN